MRRRQFSPFPLSLAMLLAAAEPVAADAPAPVVIPPVGSAAHYRVTRTQQAASGAKTVVSDVTLRRKSATTLTLDGVAGDPPSALTVLNLAPDGSLQIPAADPAASADPALTDVVSGLNRAIALFAGENSTAAFAAAEAFRAAATAAGIPAAPAVRPAPPQGASRRPSRSTSTVRCATAR